MVVLLFLIYLNREPRKDQPVQPYEYEREKSAGKMEEE